MADNREFLAEFLAEASDHLDAAEASLLTLGTNPADRPAIEACFRALHSIKGGAGFMDLGRIQALAHAAEHLLSEMREGRIAVGSDTIDALLQAVSRLRELVTSLSGNGEPAPSPGNDGPDGEWLRLLRACTEHRRPADDYAPASAGVESVATSRRYAKPARGPAPPIAVPAVTPPVERFASIPIGDIPAVVCLLAELELATATWSDPARAVLVRITALVDGIIEGRIPDTDFARIYALAGELHAALAGPAAPAAPAQVPVALGVAVGSATSAQREDFIAEGLDLLAQAEAACLVANPGPQGAEAMFRAFHTVKSMGAYLGYPRCEQLAHRVETALSPVRDGAAPFSSGLRVLVLAGIDGLRSLVEEIRTSGADQGPWPQAAAVVAMQLGLVVEASGIAPATERQALVDSGVSPQVVAEAAQQLKPGEDLTGKLVKTGRISQAQAQLAQARVQDLAKGQGQGDGFARVSTARLEELLNLVGELIIAQAMVAQDDELGRVPRLQQAVSREGRIVRNLQAISLGLRLVPLRATFQKMARAVHDTARKLGKQVEFSLEGEDVELDRTMVELIADPLLHMVRNAVDHGLETTAGRTAAGKAAAGAVRLTALQASDHIVVELSDDGRGLDADKLRRKAVEKGLVPADRELSQQECWQLIFLPGFSTAEQVTAVSGRGVGMDVVRRNLEAVKGTVTIASTLEKGTTFTIRLPLTTAILEAMILQAGSERFLVPITSVVEAVRPKPGEVKAMLGSGRVMPSRGQLLPVIALGRLFAVDGAVDDPAEAVVLVLDHAAGRVALQVDQIIGLQQVVVKPLDRTTPHHPGVGGTAILGDGRVGLILDPSRLATLN